MPGSTLQICSFAFTDCNTNFEPQITYIYDCKITVVADNIARLICNSDCLAELVAGLAEELDLPGRNHLYDISRVLRK